MPFSALIKLIRSACHQAAGGVGVSRADFYAVAA